VGIGRAFAWELARRGFDLVLASRDADALAAVAAELHQRYGRQVEVLPTDLADRRDTLALAARLEDQTRPIDLLVNNAGFGLHASLVDLDLELHARAIEVMAVAPLILQAAAARAMRARGHGAIVNVTSSSAVLTAGDYSAIKSFATINTESLAVELAGSGVAVMAVLPGWVQTEFHRRAGLKANNFPSWLGRAVWIPAAKLAAEALYDLGRGKVLSVPTGRWNFAVWLARVVPRRAIRAVSGALTKSRT
jgi:short-subunit dehydrogenase